MMNAQFKFNYLDDNFFLFKDSNKLLRITLNMLQIKFSINFI